MFLLNRWEIRRDVAAASGFTFHDVSIKSTILSDLYANPFLFTFHDVSIKSDSQIKALILSMVFTFHDVSIKSWSPYAMEHTMEPLHSTMSLLNRFFQLVCQFLCFPLHSTMSLLNPLTSMPNVSRSVTLHSTMSLLNRNAWVFGNAYVYGFTFHNVSIKS